MVETTTNFNTKSNTAKPNSIFSNVIGLEFKELDDKLITRGYIATTHLDSGFYDSNRDVFVRDRIAKETLEEWAKEINDGVPRANKVSVNHNRIPHVAGVGVKGTAKVELLPDGEYGLYVETLIDKTREDYTDLKYRIENELLDSYSIEFQTRDLITGDYLPNAVHEQVTGSGIIRTLLPSTELQGWTLASQPMNEYAIMMKEIKLNKCGKPQGKPKPKTKETTEDTNTVKEETNTETETEQSKSIKIEVENKMEQEQKTISDEDFKLFQEMKEAKLKESAEKKEKERIDALKESIRADVMKELKEFKVEQKAKLNTETENKEKEIPIEVKEFKNMFKPESKMSIRSQLLVAGNLAEKKGLIGSGVENWTTPKTLASREYKMQISNKGLEYKSLGITTNQNTDTDYLLSSAELQDMFDPVIYNILNQEHVTWNILNKDDYSNKGNNQVQFTLKIAANSTAGAYTGNAVNLGNTTRIKYMTKFKKYQAGICVDGDMIAAAKGGPVNDVFAQEVEDATIDLMSVMNQALFAEKGAETDAEVIGFEYITDQAGNTTLYNVTRSQANGLASTTTADNYINGSSADISLSNLRAAKRKCLKEGSKIQNLVYVTDHVQGDKFRGIYDALQRPVVPSIRVGFEGMPSFDGIPIFEDKDCNDDDWFLIDLESHRIAIWVPPTLEMLGKDSDSQKGFIKTYWCTYNRAPRRMVQIYSNATA